MTPVTVIGAGLAGCECAWQLAGRGIPVRLIEMKPKKMTPAHVSENFAELVCSNSLRGDRLENAVGLLKEELRRMAEIIGQNRLRVVSDEIHCDLNRTGLRRIPMGKVMQDYERLITCISTGKTFNLARLLHSNIIIRSAQERARFQARDKNIGAVNPLSIAAHQAAYTHGGP